MHSPVQSDGHQREDTGADAEHRDKLGDLAVESAEGPVTVEHVDEVEGDVERGDHGVRDGQVDEEVVRHGSHPFVREDDPDNDQVSAGRHHHHPRVQEHPQQLLPDRQDELVELVILLGAVQRAVSAIETTSVQREVRYRNSFTCHIQTSFHFRF